MSADAEQPGGQRGSADPQAWFHQLATHYVEAQIYFHLNQCGVFQRLRAGGTAGELAEALDLDERVLGSLLDYAASVGEIIHVDSDGVFTLTPFGQAVTDRYSKVNGDRTSYNMFDVRVGAWGPVWVGLGDMLRKSKVYGVDLHRAGEYAADGLFKLAAPLADAVHRAADRLAATAVVELGPTSGILAQLAGAPGGDTRRYVGVDINPQSLEHAGRLAAERGVNSIAWYHGDAFEPAGWAAALAEERRVLYFSCHFHEFLAHGEDVVERGLRELTAAPNTAGVLILEQPRMEPELRETTSSTRWLYAQSNVLIHHLIKNARILYGSQWQQLLHQGGCDDVTVEQTNGFGFTAYLGARSGRGIRDV
ncbi:class I SAM-dependent methyltransferase [Solwaraspora sp. WMMD406]|uniref:class I SAM-dependent methyltransferase n=1 Tax=Solwaraspora sp. WMMD406 TaxID=3016095 RepID=UPI0024174F42|nr:class I SAM-dependent methyltransferase [Solwaraspora sp. WMMD406]MDG4763209.1 class I SAM-dependent methyltransferase [Solwaraspora sp. WMMD406]